MKCPFCDNIEKQQTICKNKHAMCIVNWEPFNKGHVMVIPIRHITSLKDFSEKEAKSMFDLMDKILNIIKNEFEHDPLIGLNHGSWATQEHIHFHVFPTKGGLRHLMSTFDKEVPFRKRADSNELDEMKQTFSNK